MIPSQIATTGVPFLAKISMPSCFRSPPSRTAPQKLPTKLLLLATGKTNDLLIVEMGVFVKEEEMRETTIITATTRNLFIRSWNLSIKRQRLFLLFCYLLRNS